MTLRTALPLAAALVLPGVGWTQEVQEAPRADTAWNGFRGPRRDGVARGARPPLKWSAKENLAWKVELPGAGASSPIVVGDHVYVTCYSGYGRIVEDGDPKQLVCHVVCVDRATGKTVWREAIPAPLPAEAPKIQITEHGFASPTPESDGEVLYVFFGHAGLIAFDLAGKVLWKTSVGEMPEKQEVPTNQVIRDGKPLKLRWGTAASPVLCGDLVVVNASEQSNSIRAFRRSDGELVWTRESANLEGSAVSPIVAGPEGQRVIIMVLGGEVWCLNPTDGELLWSVDTKTRGGMSPTPVSDGDVVYAFGGVGEGHALRLAPGPGLDGRPRPRVAWKSLNQDIPSPVLHDGVLFLVTQRGTVSCLKAEDGSALFRGRLSGRTGTVYASPVLAGGRLYVTSREKGTFVYRADTELELLAHNEIAGDETRFDASPAVVGGQLLLRSEKYLYCFSEK